MEKKKKKKERKRYPTFYYSQNSSWKSFLWNWIFLPKWFPHAKREAVWPVIITPLYLSGSRLKLCRLCLTQRSRCTIFILFYFIYLCFFFFFLRKCREPCWWERILIWERPFEDCEDLDTQEANCILTPHTYTKYHCLFRLCPRNEKRKKDVLSAELHVWKLL